MQLSKKQVIALFLAGASANTPTDLMNSNCSEDTVAAGTLSTSMTTCSSMTTCTTNADCTTSGEVCGTMVVQDVAQADTASYCVHTNGCKNVGKMGGKAWWMACNDADYSTIADVDIVNPVNLLDNVQSIVMVSDEHKAAWNAATDLKVMAWDNYQTGWWIRGSDGIYTETDKPVIRLCETTDDCGTGLCCLNYPDTNNLRCMMEEMGEEGVQTELPPFTTWAPRCIAGTGGGPPISAEDDLANEALAQAAQQLEEFETLVLTTMKEEVDYDNMSDDDKIKFDEAMAAEKAKDDENMAADKLAAGYADLATDQKAVFDAEVLKWAKAIWEKCQDNLNGIECAKAWEMRAALEKSRKTDGYYTKDAAARETFDAAQADAQAKLKSTLTVAWVKDNKPVAGEAGSACSASNKCTDKTHCCGTATPKGNAAGSTDGQIEGVCASKTGTLTFPKIGKEYTHVCGAKALIAGAATLLAAAYAL